MIVNRLYCEFDNGEAVDFIFKSNIVLLAGDSATGKSYLYSRLQNRTLLELIGDYEKTELSLFQYLNIKDLFHLDRLLTESGTVFFIDNADTIFQFERDVPAIIGGSRNNQYLICCRNSDYFNGFDDVSHAEVVESGKRFSLLYR